MSRSWCRLECWSQGRCLQSSRMFGVSKCSEEKTSTRIGNTLAFGACSCCKCSVSCSPRCFRAREIARSSACVITLLASVGVSLMRSIVPPGLLTPKFTRTLRRGASISCRMFADSLGATLARSRSLEVYCHRSRFSLLLRRHLLRARRLVLDEDVARIGARSLLCGAFARDD